MMNRFGTIFQKFLILFFNFTIVNTIYIVLIIIKDIISNLFKRSVLYHIKPSSNVKIPPSMAKYFAILTIIDHLPLIFGLHSITLISPFCHNSPLKKSQQCTMRVKIFVRQSHNSLILRYLKIEIPVAWNAEI